MRMLNTEKRMLIIGAALSAVFGVVGTATADVVVIVNPASTVDNISSKQVKSIFLGKTRKLPGGEKASVVDQAKDSPARSVFLEKVLRKNERKLKAYWSKQVFSGKASPPKQLESDGAVKAYVAQNAGAIGYIDSSSLDETVKPVLTVK